MEVFPPNTTSKFQLLAAGIISWDKTKYRRRLLFRIFDNIDSDRKSIYNVDILTAVHWAVTEWEAFPVETIRNCYSHCFQQDAWNVPEVDVFGDVDKAHVQLERDAIKHGIAFTRIGIDAYLDAIEEDDVVESFTIKELGRSTADVKCVALEKPEKE